MAMNVNDSSDNSGISTTKKPYEKPSFRFEQVFVTSALNCGKQTDGTQNACKLVSKAS